MSQHDRPYFRYTLIQLRELYESALDDVSLLSAIALELRNRDRPAAVAFRRIVESRIAELERANVPPKDDSNNTRRPTDAGEFPNSDSHDRGPQQPKSADAGERRYHRSPDDTLRPPRQFKRIEPLGITGRPPKYVRQRRTDVTLGISEGMKRAARYAVTLAALISELKREGRGNRRIQLEDGKFIALDRGHHGYRFDFTEDAELFEDARVELQIGARRVEAQLVSISGGKIIIAVDENLGEVIDSCLLLIDDTALIAALKERLEKIGSEGRTLNTALADDAVANSGEAQPAIPAINSIAFQDLDSKKKEAVCLALGNSVFYIWGPPGTGKTHALSVLVETLAIIPLTNHNTRY